MEHVCFYYYIERRERLTASIDAGIILLMGNRHASMNYSDNTYPFRQDSSFLYYVGLDEPLMALLIDTATGENTLFGVERGIDDIIWEGPQPSLQEKAESVGLKKTAPIEQLSQQILDAKQAKRIIHYLPPYRLANKAFLAKYLSTDIDHLFPSEELIRAIVAQREIKTEEEIAQMHEASNISADMHIAAMKFARPGMKEVEVVGEMLGIATKAAGQLSYPAICSINGQTLHNHYHGNSLAEGRLLLIDAGAENSMHYAGDITRTFPISASFTSKQKDIYSIVLRCLNETMDNLKPGEFYQSYHVEVAKMIATGLKELGIMKGDVEQAVAAGAHALFFPHGLGHMIGLDVHDMEDLGEDLVGYDSMISRNPQFGIRSLRLGKKLEPGFCLTVEPGIYFIPELIEKWEAEKNPFGIIQYSKLKDYMDFGGIRIEDDCLITEDGMELLGKGVPKEIEEIEEIRKAALA